MGDGKGYGLLLDLGRQDVSQTNDIGADIEDCRPSEIPRLRIHHRSYWKASS